MTPFPQSHADGPTCADWYLRSLVLLLLVLVPRPGLGTTVADTTQSPPTTSAFDPEAGSFLQRFLGPKDYGASRQNWAAAQDSSGRLYVANSDGVLLYDGHAWRLLPTANHSAANALTADDAGRVFVGAKSEFGMIQTAPTGQKTYESLTDGLPQEHQSFGTVQNVEATNESIYFQSHHKLFRWRPSTDSLKVWSLSGTKFQHADVVRGTLYVNVTGKGLMAVQDGTLRMAPGGAQLADRSVRFLLPHGKTDILIGSFNGLLLRDGPTFRPVSTGADEVLQEAWLYDGRQLRDGTIAIATIDRGLLLLAPDGTVRRRLPARDKPVTGLYEDREGGLWALLDGGMVRYDIGAPFTAFTETSGLNGIPTDLTWHRDTLYVATNQATYRLQPSADTPASFARMTQLQRGTRTTPAWSLLSMESDLLVGTVHGLARRRSDGSVDYLFRGTQVFDLYHPPGDSTQVYAGTKTGVRRLVRRNGTWRDDGTVVPLKKQVREIAGTQNGPLWVGTLPGGTYRIRGLGSSDSLSIDQFGPGNGLPTGPIGPHTWQGEVVFGTAAGIFHRSSSRFSPHPRIERPPSGRRTGPAYVTTDAAGRTWGMTGWGPGRWRKVDSTWQWAPGRLRRFRRTRVRSFGVQDGGRAVWFGMANTQLVRHVPGSGWPRASVSPHIQRIRAYDTDSLVALRAHPAASTRSPQLSGGVHITYGAPSLVRPSEIKYQYKMDGADEGWSDWTPQTKQTYRHLGPGPHTFAVRARLANGDTTTTARYSFAVLPPWYRTWWAYGLYGLIVLGLVGGAVQWRTRWLRQRKKTLQRTVAERTHEIEEQKQKLAEQADRLREMDAAKSRFFANVSHEFRTPLTLILGPVQDLRSPVRTHLSADAGEQLDIIERNAQRLLRLVDQLLGIARMDAGSYQLNARPTDLSGEVPRIARTFEPLAERSALTLNVSVHDVTGPNEPPPPYIDHEALEHIVGNLLSNAIKFTPEGGTITVAVTLHADSATVSVSDTGPGIPASKQETIFHRFEQAQSPSGNDAPSTEGAGIGLAFAQDLVDLHGGTIDVDSAEGEGTTFTVRFPRGCQHLPEAHLASTDPSLDPSSSSSRNAPRADDDTPPGSSSASNGHSTAEAPPALPESPASPRQVLVVEDNADVRQYVRSILDTEFEVLEAANGMEGLEHAQSNLPDVILADVMMPDLNGHEMVKRLKDNPDTSAIPVIMVTARAETGDEVKGFQVGADDYITKPFDADVLRQRVGGVLTLQERLRDRIQADLQSQTDPDESNSDSAPCSALEQEARQAIRENLTDPDFDASALAHELAMSRSTLYRAFNQNTDTTPSALITEVRLERAKTLLRNDEGSVTQVAYAVGFNQLSSFSRAFRDYAGCPPSAFPPENTPAQSRTNR